MTLFRTSGAAVAPADEVASSDLVPLSLLGLEMDAPAEGWPSYLEAHGVDRLVDVVGRNAVSVGDARALLAEYRETVAREREAAARKREALEREAEERDRAYRAQIWKGVPASAFPWVESAASVMVAAIRDSQPKRESVLQEALSNSGGITYHSLAPTGDES